MNALIDLTPIKNHKVCGVIPVIIFSKATDLSRNVLIKWLFPFHYITAYDGKIFYLWYFHVNQFTKFVAEVNEMSLSPSQTYKMLSSL